MLYEIINPSDPATFEAPDLMTAGLVTLLLGHGQYGAKPEDNEAPDVPLMLFGGLEDWWGEHFEEPLKNAVERHREKVCATLRTVAYGDANQRRLFDSAMAAIDDPDKRSAFVAEWNDAKRSSLNDIMGRAHALADDLDKPKDAAA